MLTRKIVIIGASLMLVVAFLAVGIGTLKHRPSQALVASGCTARQFDVGSSGTCVNDIQTMINYMETSGLNECPFVGAQRLPINGTYDSATKVQVSTVQTWINCYSKQEGSQTSVSVTGKVDSATWHLFCSYAYQFPSQSNSSVSPFRQASIAAGKNAGC